MKRKPKVTLVEWPTQEQLFSRDYVWVHKSHLTEQQSMNMQDYGRIVPKEPMLSVEEAKELWNASCR